ncbi:DUF4037 domain-containing protein [bacterium]|nr:DUF4037 domain-containing protein [bacterium]
MPDFIPGLALSQSFFEDAVRPLLDEYYPNLSYSAARLEWGSDVIGFDTPMSMDHGWGPKVTLFLTPKGHAHLHDELWDFFANNLPFTIRDIPTHFGEPLEDGGKIAFKESYPLHHMVTITTPALFFRDTLGVDINKPLTPVDWLTIPQQRLRTVRAGRIYHDGLGTLTDLRRRFHWYPTDVWRYLLAGAWQRIDQEAPFLGRTAVAGDELGSRLLAGRQITDMMALAFLIEKQFAPYWKWFGSAFQQLDLAADLMPLFASALDGQTWKIREGCLNEALIKLVQATNALGLAADVPAEVSLFHGRPFLVPPAGQLVDALLAAITDPAVSALPQHLGGINQISDNTDLLDSLDHCRKMRVIYKA